MVACGAAFRLLIYEAENEGRSNGILAGMTDIQGE